MPKNGVHCRKSALTGKTLKKGLVTYLRCEFSSVITIFAASDSDNGDKSAPPPGKKAKKKKIY